MINLGIPKVRSRLGASGVALCVLLFSFNTSAWAAKEHSENGSNSTSAVTTPTSQTNPQNRLTEKAREIYEKAIIAEFADPLAKTISEKEIQSVEAFDVQELWKEKNAIFREDYIKYYRKAGYDEKSAASHADQAVKNYWADKERTRKYEHDLRAAIVAKRLLNQKDGQPLALENDLGPIRTLDKALENLAKGGLTPFQLKAVMKALHLLKVEDLRAVIEAIPEDSLAKRFGESFLSAIEKKLPALVSQMSKSDPTSFDFRVAMAAAVYGVIDTASKEGGIKAALVLGPHIIESVTGVGKRFIESDEGKRWIDRNSSQFLNMAKGNKKSIGDFVDAVREWDQKHGNLLSKDRGKLQQFLNMADAVGPDKIKATVFADRDSLKKMLSQWVGVAVKQSPVVQNEIRQEAKTQSTKQAYDTANLEASHYGRTWNGRPGPIRRFATRVARGEAKANMRDINAGAEQGALDAVQNKAKSAYFQIGWDYYHKKPIFQSRYGTYGTQAYETAYQLARQQVDVGAEDALRAGEVAVQAISEKYLGDTGLGVHFIASSAPKGGWNDQNQLYAGFNYNVQDNGQKRSELASAWTVDKKTIDQSTETLADFVGPFFTPDQQPKKISK